MKRFQKMGLSQITIHFIHLRGHRPLTENSSISYQGASPRGAPDETGGEAIAQLVASFAPSFFLSVILKPRSGKMAVKVP